MHFRFWEYVFFVSAFGTVVFFYGARDLMPLLAIPAYAFNAGFAGIVALLGLALYERSMGSRTRKQALIIAAATGCVAVLVSMGGHASSPEFALWSLNAAIAVCTFGSILARRFFRRVERDFRRNAAHVLALGLAFNTAGLLTAHLLVLFPPIMIGVLMATITLVALL
ncbi:MAG: hypothetical protein EXS60_00270 [Candidatus Pacebacteria bacterium]|nr:hypothetical protein [Candidatus Paceibacterota bacterium]